jgi:hypothetical protein
MGSNAMSGDEVRALASELAALTLEDAAPEELALFPEISEEYFRDPDGVINPRSRDEAVGFGLDIAMLTPYLLAVAMPVVQLLASAVHETAKEEVKTSLAGAVRRLLRRDQGAPAEPGAQPALSPEQARLVRQTAYEQARGLGVDEERAGLLADSLVGRLLVA